MKVIYVGSVVDDQLEEKLASTKTLFTKSGTTFQRALLSGFEENNFDLKIINAPDIGSFPLRSKMIITPFYNIAMGGIQGVNCSFFNITYIKKLSILYQLKKFLRSICKSRKDENIVIIVYSLIYPYIKAAVDIKNEFPNVYICPIVLDLPEYFDEKEKFINKLLPKEKDYIRKMYNDFDSAIILTSQMENVLKLKDKPILLLEGIFNNKCYDDTIVIKKKSILYSGNLDSRFGIDVLLEAFRLIIDTDAELWICGNGSMKDEVVKRAHEDKRIKYFGVLRQDKVFRLQKAAKLLINPRQNIGEYTKYSFPSKTMEYMASGTPVLMYRLDGVPEEYYDYLITPQSNSIHDLSVIMQLWLNKPQIELNTFGSRAKSFIISNKSSQIQASRVINFLQKNYG